MTISSILMRAAALAAFAAVSLGPVAAQDIIQGSTLDGATFELPSRWVIGEPLILKGENWTTLDGNMGSVIGVKYDFGGVVPREPVDELDDIWARIHADRKGSYAFELPYPDEAGWSAGEEHTIHLLTGSLGHNDKVRNPTLRVTLVEAQ